MALQLPVPNPHDGGATWKRLIEQADQQNVKQGRDIIVNPGRVILTSPNGQTWSITVSNAGVLTAVAVTLPPTRGAGG